MLHHQRVEPGVYRSLQFGPIAVADAVDPHRQKLPVLRMRRRFDANADPAPRQIGEQALHRALGGVEAQGRLEHLADRRERNRVDEVDLHRHRRPFRRPLAREREQLGRLDRRPGPALHEGDRQLAGRRKEGNALATLLLGAGFTLTMLGHYGMMLAVLAIVGLFAAWVIIMGRSDGARPRLLLAAFGGALGTSFALYYWRFLTEMWNQWSGTLQRAISRGAVAPQPASPVAQEEALYARLTRRLARLVGLPSLFGAIAGLALPARHRAVAALIGAWLAAAAIFFALDQTLGDAIRWHYLAAAPVALMAGVFASGLTRRGNTARALVALALAVVLWHLLQIWVGDLIFTRYHTE